MKSELAVRYPDTLPFHLTMTRQLTFPGSFPSWRRLASVLLLVLLGALALPVSAQYIRVAGIGGNYGERAVDDIFARGLVEGEIDRGLTTTQFNAMSAVELRNQYDVLLVSWYSDENLNLDWSTRLLPYMQLGGGIIWEDSLNLADLSPAIDGLRSCVSDGSGVLTINNISAVPGLTDGVGNTFDPRCHIRFPSWGEGLSPFMQVAGYTLGLYGEFGSGRIVLGLDNDFHGIYGNNHYTLLTNELTWVTGAAMPIPAPLWLLVSGLLALTGLARSASGRHPA